MSKVSLSIISIAVLASLSSCSDNDNDNDTSQSATFILSNNGATNVGTASLINQNSDVSQTFTSGNNEGVDINSFGNMVHAGDSTVGSLRTICNVSKRSDGDFFNENVDRDLTGSNTGLLTPKGIQTSENLGLTFVADSTAETVSVFGNQAAGDVAPVATMLTDAAPWDLAYDEDSDRLYVALTNGTVAVYDNYVSSEFADTPARTITPSDATLAQISVNIHGIVYESVTDTLVLSDVGSAPDPSDGSLFVIEDASSVDGNVAVSRSISGPSSTLGNPVDIVLSGSDLRVAEKSNSAILLFKDIFTGSSGDIAPDSSTTTSGPESLVEITSTFDGQDVSDSTDTSIPIVSVAVSSNPATVGETSNMIGRFDDSLISQLGSYDTGLTQESMTFDAAGNSYATFDGDSVGVLISTKVATLRSDDSFDTSYDRVISGNNTGLVSPKGLDVASDSGLIFVAENDASNPGIMIYSSCASGNAAPLMILTTIGSVSPWDVDYDAETDKAFVALTDGSIAVFDQVVEKMDSGTSIIAEQDRTILPAIDGAAIDTPTNIHGIDYDPQTDSLIVSDVGSAADATDGKIYVLNDAADASGLVDIAVNIAGPNTNLGNPVDIMFTGTNLYVAEKSNSLVMRYDDVLNSDGGDISATISISYTSPESVAIMPESLWPQ